MTASIHALFLALLALLLAGEPAAGQPVPASAPMLQGAGARHLAIELIAETGRPAAGSTVTLAFASRPEAGWHGYWSNPGDAGVPTRAQWHLPAGVKAGALRWPAPGRLLIAGLMNYVYERPFAPLVNLSTPAGLRPGTRLPIRVTLDYLVCTTSICVPEQQTLATDLTVGDGAVAAGMRARFDAWRRALPRPLGSTATWQSGDTFRLSIPFPAAVPARDASFYPLAGGVIDHAAPQRIARDGDRLIVETRPAAGAGTGAVEGVLATAEGAFALVARPGIVAAPDGGEEAGAGGWRAILLALAGAFVGGMLLNVMPCVFPILSLKALALVRHGIDPVAARREAIAYAAGVILVCLAMGAAILALRAGGSAVGWAFQLQDPRAIAVLMLLAIAIALNLAGLFELPVPRFAGRTGPAGAFATGALAAFVATPCSGPFMGAALGAALVLPVPAALAVFAGLGLGIAAPFLAIGFVPALRRRLPRPGAWLGTMRRILALPMFATALALAWVLGRQAGAPGLTMGLAAALLAGVALWWLGLRQHRGARGWPAAAVLALALIPALAVGPAVSRPAGGTDQATGAEPFSEARLAALRAEGRPVFAYFTADWCLTCKVNERVAIKVPATARAFARGRVAVLVGDWTDGDPALGRFLARHGRAGVPLYLWYPAGASGPRVLPQVLTPGMLGALPAGA